MRTSLEPSSSPWASHTTWRTISAVNLALGILLWIGYLTDLSLAGTMADWMFPLLAGVLAYYTLFAAPYYAPADMRSAVRRACIPSLAGGIAFVLAAVLMLVPPFTFDTLEYFAGTAIEHRIESVVSPGGGYTAETILRGMGALPGQQGELTVRVKPRLFPLIERDLAVYRVRFTDERVPAYLSWKDDRRIEFAAVGQVWDTGQVLLALPPALEGPGRPLAVLAGRPTEVLELPALADGGKTASRGGFCCIGPLIIPLIFPPVVIWGGRKRRREPAPWDKDSIYWP